MKKFTGIAPAKINLFLEVEEKLHGQDFHQVENVMQTLSLHDKLFFLVPETQCDEKEIESRRNRKINDVFGIKEACFSTYANKNIRASILIDDHTGQNFKIEANDNLVSQAIRKASEIANFSDNINIEVWIDKNIPAQAGLGGGSSDAAVALILSKKIFGLTDNQVLEVAKTLGADVPFFLSGGRSKMKGSGAILAENLTSLKKPIVLVKPNAGVSTKKCYEKFDEVPKNSPAKGSFLLKNDLEKPACTLCPEISEVLEFLRSLCKKEDVLMSGSGSACFAICDTFEVARKVATLATKNGWWSRACSCVDLKASVLDDK